MKTFFLFCLAGLVLMGTGCKLKFVKGSISGTVFIVRGDEEYKGSYYGLQLVDSDGTVLGFTQSGTNGHFRFETMGEKGNSVSLKIPWGKYTINIFAPSMGSTGGGAEPEPVYSKKINLRSGAHQERIYMDWEDIRPGR